MHLQGVITLQDLALSYSNFCSNPLTQIWHLNQRIIIVKISQSLLYSCPLESWSNSVAPLDILTLFMHVLDLIIVSVELFDMFPAIMMMINNAIKTVVRLYSKISNQDCTIIGKKK